MTPDELDGLLWELIDGSIESADRGRLEAYLARHPEAGARREELNSIAAALASVVAVEPPADLVPAIEHAIAARAPQQRARSPVIEALRALLTPRWPVRLAWAVLGLLVGVAAAMLLATADFGTTGRGDLSRFYGAMHFRDGFPQVRGPAIDIAAGAGTLALARDGRVIVLDLVSRGERAEEISVALAADGLEVEAIRQRGPAESACTVTSDQIVLAVGGSNEAVVRVVVPPGVERIRLSVTAGGQHLVDRELAVDGIPEL